MSKQLSPVQYAAVVLNSEVVIFITGNCNTTVRIFGVCCREVFSLSFSKFKITITAGKGKFYREIIVRGLNIA